MNFSSVQKFTFTNSLLLIEELREAEICRDAELSRQLLIPYWENLDDEPDFSLLDDLQQAEMYRLCGAFLSLYGYAKSLKNYQERAKNFISSAIDIFTDLNLAESIADANIMLAHCYWFAGETREAESILETAESNFAENQLDPIYLQIQVNRIMICFRNQTPESFQLALQLIEDIQIPIEICSNHKIKSQFYNMAGLIYRSLNQFDKACIYYQEAIVHAKKSKNQRFVAANLNNLAYLYKKLIRSDFALKFIDESINILEQLNDQGWLPHAMDTKALIYLDMKDYKSALGIIDQAISIFRQGDDHAGLTDALWTKCKCLFQLQQKNEAILIFFTELGHLARTFGGEFAARRYLKELSEYIYIPDQEIPYTEKVNGFKKFLIKRALVDSGCKIEAAAQSLQLKNHQSLSNILNHQFPEIYDELGMTRRAKRSDYRTDDIDIFRTEKTLIFDEDVIEDFDIRLFIFSREIMQKAYDLNLNSIVAVSLADTVHLGETVLIHDSKKFRLGTIESVQSNSRFLLSDLTRKRTRTFDFDVIIGKPIAYSSVTNSINQEIIFETIE